MIDPSFGKSSFGKHHNSMFKHTQFMDPKTNKWKFDKEQQIYSLKLSPHKVPINPRRKNCNFAVKKAKLIHISLIKWLQLKAPRGEQIEIMCLFNIMHWKVHSITSEGISAQMQSI